MNCTETRPNLTGAELCEQQAMSPTALGQRLAREFQVGERRAARDARVFLEELLSAGCVERLGA